MKNSLQYLFLHCLLTKPSYKVSADDVRKWHMEDNGWSRPGYADLLLRGSLENLVPFDQDNEVDHNEMTWGVKGLNGVSRHLGLEGGLGEDGSWVSPLSQFPGMQKRLEAYVKYTLMRHPQVKVVGHYQFDDKKPFCPGFSVSHLMRYWGISKDNYIED